MSTRPNPQTFINIDRPFPIAPTFSDSDAIAMPSNATTTPHKPQTSIAVSRLCRLYAFAGSRAFAPHIGGSGFRRRRICENGSLLGALLISGQKNRLRKLRAALFDNPEH
jgi:hypothetical protein